MHNAWRRYVHARFGAAAVLLALAVGTSVRLWGLERRSLWFDEAFSWRLARFDWKELIVRAAADNNPPLYYVFLKVWQGVAGEGLLALRLPSAIFGVAAILRGALWARETAAWQCTHGGGAGSAKLAGAVAAWLIAASPLHVRWSWDARMYSLAGALAVFSGWSLVRLLRRGTWGPWCTLAACGTALCYTHSTGVLLMAALSGVLLVVAVMPRKLPAPGPAANRRAIFALVCLMAVSYGPWAVVAVQQARKVKSDFWSGSLTLRNAETALYQTFFDPEDPIGTYAPEARLLAIFCAAVCLGSLRRAVPGMWSLVAAALGSALLLIAASLAVRNLFFPRYLVLSHLAFLVLLGTAVARLRQRQGLQSVAAAVLIVCSLAVMGTYLTCNTRFWSSPGMRAAANWIESERGPHEPVIASTTLVYYPLLYHMHERHACRLYPDTFTLRTHYFGTAALCEEDVLEAGQLDSVRGMRVWLVEVSGGGWGQWEVPVPKNWRLLQVRRFRKALPVQGEVVVSLYAAPALEDAAAQP